MPTPTWSGARPSAEHPHPTRAILRRPPAERLDPHAVPVRRRSRFSGATKKGEDRRGGAMARSRRGTSPRTRNDRWRAKEISACNGAFRWRRSSHDWKPYAARSRPDHDAQVRRGADERWTFIGGTAMWSGARRWKAAGPRRSRQCMSLLEGTTDRQSRAGSGRPQRRADDASRRAVGRPHRRRPVRVAPAHGARARARGLSEHAHAGDDSHRSPDRLITCGAAGEPRYLES